MTTTRRGTGPGIQCLPEDLSRFLGARGLLRLALDAVQAIDSAGFAPEDRCRPAYRPQMLLMLLTYCYASRIYGSRDVEWATRYDKTVRYICARTFPDWNALRRFRRRNRALLEQTLAYVFKQSWALKFDDGETDYVGYDWFESELNREVRKAAINRIEVATLMDGTEND
jgi:transposase